MEELSHASALGHCAADAAASSRSKAREAGASVPGAQDKEERERHKRFWDKNWAQTWTGWKEPALDTQTYYPNFLKMVLQDFSEKWLLEH